MEVVGLSTDAGKYGKIPEWPNGADCKSAGVRLRWFESISSHTRKPIGVATVNDGNGASMRFIFAEVAQLIEHQPSKLRVASLSLVFRSTKMTSDTPWFGSERVRRSGADCPFICG